jgi:hypothetical protein
MRSEFLSLVVVFLMAAMPGCFEGRLCSPTLKGDETKEIYLCNARLEFDDTASLLSVVHVEPGRTVRWDDQVPVVQPGHENLVRAAFGAVPDASSPPFHSNFTRVAHGEMKVGQFIGFCGPPASAIGFTYRQWVGSVRTIEVHLQPCD